MKRQLLKLSALAALALGLAVSPAAAASLQLKDGTLVRGTYLGGTSATVNFQVDGQVKQYNVSDIMLIDFGAGGSAGAAPTTSASANGTAGGPADSAPAASMPSQASDPPQPAPPAPAASTATSNSVTVPAGTHLLVRMIDSIDSDTNHVGDTFQASLAEPLAVGDRVLAPKDALVYGRLVEARQAGHIQGQSELRVELTGIQINNQTLSIVTSNYDVAGQSRGEQSAKRAGVGAGLGALIGALAGGGKGAAIGAGIGAGTAGAVQVLTHGSQIRIPSETELDFTISQPFNVPTAS
jgi:hypothetical protein